MIFELIIFPLFFFIIIGISFLFNSKKMSFNLIYAYFFVAFTSTIIAFLYKLSIFVEFFWICFGIFNLIYFKDKTFKLFYKTKMNFRIIPSFIYFYILLILFLLSFSPFLVDHFTYYIPSIKILNEFGLFRGVSNISWSFGQMAFTHIFQATFSHILDIYLRSNFILILIFIIYLIESKKYILTIFLPIFSFFIQSPSPDLLVFILSLIIINEYFFQKNYKPHELLILSALLFVSKPTAFILFPFLFFMFFKTWFTKNNFKYLIFSVGIIFFYILKNCLISGVPFFPLNIFILDVFWSPTKEILEISHKVAQISTFHQKFSNFEIEQFSFLEKLKFWIFLDGYLGILHSFIFIIFIGLIILTIIKQEIKYFILTIFIAFKIIFIFEFSGQFRFLIDILLIIFYLFIYCLKKYKILNYLGLIGLIFISINLFFPLLRQKKIINSTSFSIFSDFNKEQFIKPSTYKLNKFITYKIGNLNFNINPKYIYSFDIKPITFSKYTLKDYLNLKIFPQYKGNSIKDGIYLKKLNSKEIQELQKIQNKILKDENNF